jgi:hypothetical protein
MEGFLEELHTGDESSGDEVAFEVALQSGNSSPEVQNAEMDMECCQCV